MRTRLQFGNIVPRPKQNGPDVWQYRWRERSGGKVIRRGVILGTVDEYPTQTFALKAAEQWRISANDEAPRRMPATFSATLDRYEREQMPDRISAHALQTLVHLPHSAKAGRLPAH